MMDVEKKNTKVKNPIPYEVALMLCNEIKEEVALKWTTASARWCYACQASRDDSEQVRGFTLKPGNRGCVVVNARYARLQAAGRNQARN